MEQSILRSVKQAVGVSPDDPSFDIDIIMAINAEFSILNDLGVGPAEGFVIEDESTEWSEYLDDLIMLSKVKTAVNLKTRLLFDPPKESFVLTSYQNQLQEQEWRLNVNREATEWVDPNPRVVIDELGEADACI
jgi:hypothetical protein